MGHALFAPSSAKTWINCSYSARNAVPNPPKPQSTIDAAEAGTEDHEGMEEAVTFAEMEASEHAPLWFDFMRQLEPGDTYTELWGELTPECGGTTDYLRVPYSARIVTFADYKFGKWDVDAKDNEQQLSYAAIHLDRLRNYDYFRLVIFQPNGLEETPFKQWVHTRAEVEAHRARMYAAINDRSPPKPGPWCRWCNAFQTCSAMSMDANFVVGAMARPPESLTTHELVRLLRLVRALGDMKKVYEDALTTHLKMGRTADGAALKPGRRHRSWNDPTQAAQVLYQYYGPKGVRPPTPAQAEKLGLEGKKYAAVGAHKPEAQLKAHY